MYTHLSWLIPLNSPLFSSFVCILKLAVNTIWPTVALNPLRKALNGYTTSSISFSL